MSGWAARRFWDTVSVEEGPEGYCIVLDKKPVRTPSKALLQVPTQGLAEAIAAEWQRQDKLVDPRTMPFTRAANSAIDKVAVQRADVIEMLAAYGANDLLCYRADAPAALVDRQAAAWDPLLDWADRRHGARLQVTTGIIPVDQPSDAVDRLAQPMQGLSDFQLTGFHDLVTLSGSLVLALAVIDQQIALEAAWQAARLDEIWQIEQWGADEEAEAFAASKQADFCHALQLYRLSQG